MTAGKDIRDSHFKMSIIKSGFRFLAGFLLIVGLIPAAGIFFIVAEVMGVLEEL